MVVEEQLPDRYGSRHTERKYRLPTRGSVAELQSIVAHFPGRKRHGGAGPSRYTAEGRQNARIWGGRLYRAIDHRDRPRRLRR